MPKATKVGQFRSASRASSRDVRTAPLTSESASSYHKKQDPDEKVVADRQANADAAAANDEDARFPRERDDVPLSRGQRKRLAKREQYLKRENMVMSSLRLRRLEDQKGKLDGLDAIREALSEALTSPTPPTSDAAEGAKKLTCNTNRSKRTLANSEISHMSLVLSHPKFNEDPFAAIRLHLQNSLADDAEKLKAESKARDEEYIELVAKKKEAKKERIREAKFSNKKRRSGKSARPGIRR